MRGPFSFVVEARRKEYPEPLITMRSLTAKDAKYAKLSRTFFSGGTQRGNKTELG